MLFMVIEHFQEGKIKDIYRRFQEKGRMMPKGLNYIDSWISADFDRCFQEWILQWGDLGKFEIIPIVSSKKTTEIVTKSC
ncbi:MAG: hypothetical protein RLZZ171_444 [Cyanobacteriota bacterium]